MKKHTRLLLVSTLLLLLGLVLGACGQAAQPSPEVVTEVVEKEVTKVVKETEVVEVEKEVEKEVVVTPTPVPIEERETIPIGGFGPLSAPGSYQSGTQMRQAVEMAVDEINEAGGILGKQVEVIFGDTEGLPERGTAVTERLITQNNVVGLTGEYHSAVALTEMEVAHRYGIPTVFAEPWADDVTGKQYPEIFRIAPSIEYFSSISVNYIDAVGWESIVFILEDTDYGRQQGEEWQAQLEDLGITDVEIIYADPATEDFTPILQRIQQDPPELLAGVITGIGNSRLLRQACDLGLAPTAETAYYASVDSQLPEFWENAGDCGQYVFFTYVGLPQSLWNENTERFMSTFEERYQTQPGGPAMEAYDAAYLLLNAMDEAGTTEAGAVIEALEGIEHQGVLGDIWFEYGSDNPVPDDEPAWKWHQWLTPNVFIIQYTEPNQSIEDAAVVFPEERANAPLYTSP